MKIGIIGGSGLDNVNLIEDYEEKEVETEYGKPSSTITCGKINGIEVCILSRHGKNHEIPPTQVNYRANIAALAKLGVTHIIATTAVGSLKEKIMRGDLVILNQFIDFTKHRKLSFYESFNDKPVHVSLAEPFSSFLREKLIQGCEELGLDFHSQGTVITIEGNRFSTRAESTLFRSWGADVINMSIAPEAILAREAGLEYAVIAMSTDYDCWKQDEEPVSWEEILEIFNKNAEKVKKLILHVIKKISVHDEEFIKSKIRTIPDFPKPGIQFRDITTLLKDKQGFSRVIEIFYERYKDKGINVVAGIESRGFILAGILAEKLNAGLVLVRKPGKLPGETINQEYELEYGSDKVEIHRDAISSGDKVLLVDDLLATGGTSLASASLIQRLGGEIVEIAFIIELSDLLGKQKLEQKGYKVFNIVSFRNSDY